MKIFRYLQSRIKRTVALCAVALFGLIAVSFDDNYFEVSKNLDVYATLLRELNLYYVDEIEPGEMVKTSIDAMLEDLDPYTVYIAESEIEDYRLMFSGEYGGIGALIGNHGPNMTITELYEGYAAKEAGIMVGDVLKEVDGIDVSGKNTEQVSNILKGAAGSKLNVVVERGSETFDFTLDRQKVKIPDVPYYGMVDETTGYIKLTSFTESASSEVNTAFKALKDEGMTQLVFDLRGNGGGLMMEAVNIVNMFVPRGQEVVATKGKIEKWNRSSVTLNQPVDLEIPIAVLMDGGSASASEIVAGSLQDLDRAVIIGTTSFGKGLVQQPRDLTYGAKLKVTIAKYYTPSGRCIQKLDYSNRNDLGVVEEVPDSLLRSFKTKNGREVFDGRGVEPEITIEQPQLSNLTVSLLVNHLIFDYATDYSRSHEEIGEASAFRISDEDFTTFKTWVLAQEFDYSSQTIAYLDNLEKMAEKEQYKAMAETEFAALRAQLTPNKGEDMKRFENEIRVLLEDEIVSRYYQRKGQIQHALSVDPYISTSIETLGNSAEYNSILGN